MAKMAKRKAPRKVQGKTRRRGNAAYRKVNRGRAEEVQGAIEAAVREGAKIREAISKKIERRIATAEARERRASRRR
ncbi:MAG TPA: hypothetical protein VIG99_23150 [Myxococcaceae bacterium]|jgi:hypothetical protein